MALLWSHTQSDGERPMHYEVRSAGATLRLYTNGAFHSQYNPNRLLTGGVWNLLALPALFTGNKVKRVLMLGVGGGTAIHHYKKLCRPAMITGIELDPVHLKVARRFFACVGDDITLIEADALAWISEQRSRFDVVVDDLFIDGADDPVRPGAVDTPWLAKLARRLAPRGVLIQNHLSPTTARQIASLPRVKSQFASAIEFTTPGYENSVLALFRQTCSARVGRQRTMATLASMNPRAARELTFSARQLF